MSGVRMLHFLKDWWKFIQFHQYYTMALTVFSIENQNRGTPKYNECLTIYQHGRRHTFDVIHHEKVWSLGGGQWVIGRANLPIHVLNSCILCPIEFHKFHISIPIIIFLIHLADRTIRRIPSCLRSESTASCTKAETARVCTLSLTSQDQGYGMYY